MVEWHPITAEALASRVKQGLARMSERERSLWEAIRIEPEKWKQDPYGNNGDGFWVLAVIGRSVIWYNDIEDGFNRSCYSTYGRIDDYWCNQDELEVTVREEIDLGCLRVLGLRVSGFDRGAIHGKISGVRDVVLGRAIAVGRSSRPARPQNSRRAQLQ